MLLSLQADPTSQLSPRKGEVGKREDQEVTGGGGCGGIGYRGPQNFHNQRRLSPW